MVYYSISSQLTVSGVFAVSLEIGLVKLPDTVNEMEIYFVKLLGGELKLNDMFKILDHVA